MSSRLKDLERLQQMLNDELITHEEFSTLKDELLSEAPESAETCEKGRHSPEPNSDASHDPDRGEFNDSSGLMATVHSEIAELKAKTLASLHLTEETLKQVDGGDFILKGIFIKGVELHTRLVLRPESDLRSLVKIKPELLSKAIYMGVIETIDYVIEKFEGVEPPMVVRGFMASYSLAAWNHLVEAGIDFDPGEGKMPGDFFNRLGVADFGVDTTLSRSTETSIDPQDHPGSADVIPVTVKSRKEASSQAIEGVESEVAELRAQVFESFMEVSEEDFAQMDDGEIALVGIDAFVVGVIDEVHDVLRNLIEVKPTMLPMAIYMGVTDAINDYLAQADFELSLFVRGFIASFSLAAWQRVEATGIDFDPGEGNWPTDLLERLDFNQDRIDERAINLRPAVISLKAAARDSIPRSEQEASATALEALSQVHREMGLTSLPVFYSVGVLQALRDMAASGILYNTGDLDGFRLVIGSMRESLTKQQRKMLGYSFLNRYPERAVVYVKAIVAAASESGVFDYSPKYVAVILNKPPGA